MPRPTEPIPSEGDRPSRSARRREALDVLAFARQLSEQPPARLDKLALPDDIRDELADVQRTPSHIAHKRQLAHLAKLMRAHDESAFAAARAALANDKASSAREAAALHRLEAQRDRLLNGGDAAFHELVERHPNIDRQHLRSLVRQARVEKITPNKPPRAYREIFKLLKDLQAGDAAEN